MNQQSSQQNGFQPIICAILSLTLGVVLLPSNVSGRPFQSGAGEQQETQLDAAMRTAVIDAALKNLNEAYVFPEVAKKMEQAIRERVQKKEYDAITNPAALAATLTANLQEVSHDKHLRIMYRRGALPSEHSPGAEEREANRMMNFGFEKLERLEGNVGYLDLRGFQHPDWAAETAAAAMNFLANTDALIIDVRNNGGGSGEMVALLCSYLLNTRTHINDFYWRPTNKTTESWTREQLAGKRYGDKREVYVLTSRRTFSAAEEFAYDLKNLKRATLVGEVTGGGAHPVEFRSLVGQFAISLPAGRAINPITKMNWEGTGVKPDIEVPAEQALKAAHLAAMKSVVQKITDPRRRERAAGLIASLQRELDSQVSSGAAKVTPPANQTASAAPSGEEGKLPETPAGKTFAAFLKAFNSGDLDVMKRFHTERADTDENGQQDYHLFQQTGGLRVHSVIHASDYEISVLVQKKNDGGWLDFAIHVRPSPPYAIEDIGVKPAAAPITGANEVKMPDTPAGKILAAYLQVLNSGDMELMKRFHAERGDPDDAAQQDFNFYNQSGGLKLSRVVSSADYHIAVLAQGKKTGRWLNFSIIIRPSPPYAIDEIRAEPVTSPDAKIAASPDNVRSENALAKVMTRGEAIKEIDSLLDKQATADKFSGAVLIAKDGKAIYTKAYGLANRSKSQPNQPDTKFNLGSMNKMFTSVAIAQLAEAGKLSFDDKVGKYLPDYPNKDVREKVTIHQLLTHTSGLGSYWNKQFDEKRESIKTVNDYLALFATEPLRFEPGARFDYSNSGFIVLGAIVEKVSGMSYYDYVRENIYKRAGMTNTDAYEMNSNTPNLAMGYTTEGMRDDAPAPRKENTASRPNRGGPAGGGYSTVEDLLKFANALMANKLLSPAYTTLITTGKVAFGPGKYAYGFGDVPVNGKRTVGHNGGSPGVASDLTIFTETGYTVAIMTNYDPQDSMPVMRLVKQIISQIE